MLGNRKRLIYAMRRPFRRPKRLFMGLMDHLYDYSRFSKYSSTVGRQLDEKQLAAAITKQYHRIEKGLSLPNPRPGFGGGWIATTFLDNIREHERRFGSSVATRGARSSIAAYLRYHKDLDMTFPPLEEFLASGEAVDPGTAGTIELTRDQVANTTQIPYEEFVNSRYSVRHYTGEPVQPEEIEKAVSLANRSPRVCNRGTIKVHVAYDPAIRQRILAHQNGNEGFGHQAGAVLILTSDMRGFTDFGERNQCWIDGGLFAMSLVYALHAQGLGTCMLNWSVTSGQDRRMRKEIGIPAQEAVITMMAVGRLPDRFKVAISPRDPVRDIIQTLE